MKRLVIRVECWLVILIVVVFFSSQSESQQDLKYLDRIEAYLKVNSPIEHPLVAMVFTAGAGDLPSPEIMEFIKGIGVNTLQRGNSLKTLQDAKETGFDTIWSVTTNVRRKFFNHPEILENPEYALRRYILGGPVTANSNTVDIPVGGWSMQGEVFVIDTENDPKVFWRVNDRTAKTVVPPENWEFDKEGNQVRVKNAIPGHQYEAVFMIRFAGRLDYTLPAVQDAMAKELENLSAKREGFWDMDEADIGIYYGNLDKVGFPGRFYVNFYGYTCGTCPENQKKITEETGIPFDPNWLVDEGRDGNFDYPPRPEYLAWMKFIQKGIMEYSKKMSAALHKHGVKVMWYWGDQWIGMEPYLGMVDEGGIDIIRRPVPGQAYPTMTRSLMDVPSSAVKCLRFQPWFRPELPPLDSVQRSWKAIRRGILFKMPDGLIFGGDMRPPLDNPIYRQEVKKMIVEFRLFHALLKNRKVFTHHLNLYVVNAWGKIRSWPEDWDVNPSQIVLRNLIDLPVNVNFISLSEIASAGVPSDADILMNVGEAGSSWSGGYFWKSPQLLKNIAIFVKGGGGLIGIGAPSHFSQGNRIWQLWNILGVEYAGATSEDMGKGIYSPNEAHRVGLTAAPPFPVLIGGKTKTTHWINEGLAQGLDLKSDARGRIISQNTKTLYQAGTGEPLVTVHNYGKGRTVYIAGYNDSFVYYALLRKVIFWTAHQEAQYSQLLCETPGVFLYLYPEIQSLILYNSTDEPVEAGIQLDVGLLNLPLKTQYTLTQYITGNVLTEKNGMELKQGVKISLLPQEVKLIKVQIYSKIHLAHIFDGATGLNLTIPESAGATPHASELTPSLINE